MFKIIAAVGKNGELGKDGGLVFHIREDMEFFKAQTMGKSVVMGLKTFESLPGGALKGRKNYVITHHPEKLPPEVVPVTDLKQFVRENATSDEEIYVIGGAYVYSEMLPFTEVIYLTEIEAEAEADVFFPNFDKNLYNKTIIKRGQENDLIYNFVKYEIKQKGDK